MTEKRLAPEGDVASIAVQRLQGMEFRRHHSSARQA